MVVKARLPKFWESSCARPWFWLTVVRVAAVERSFPTVGAGIGAAMGGANSWASFLTAGRCSQGVAVAGLQYGLTVEVLYSVANRTSVVVGKATTPSFGRHLTFTPQMVFERFGEHLYVRAKRGKGRTSRFEAKGES